MRTGWGRSEAYADLAAQAPPPVARPARPGRRALGVVWLVPARIRHGRPLHLAARILAAVLLAVIAARSGAGSPAAAGVVAGLGVWLVLTARGDLAPPPGR